MAERVTTEQKLSVRCPTCGAKAGDRCQFIQYSWHNAVIGFVSPHKERRAKYLRQKGLT